MSKRVLSIHTYIRVFYSLIISGSLRLNQLDAPFTMADITNQMKLGEYQQILELTNSDWLI